MTETVTHAQHAAGLIRTYTGTRPAHGIIYRGYSVRFEDAPYIGPIWLFCHEDDEPAPDGEGGWINPARSGGGPSLEDCIRQIDDQIADATP